MNLLSSVFAALHPGFRWHHRSPSHPGGAPLYKGQQCCEKPAYFHHILCVRIMYTAADGCRYQVTWPESLTLVNQEESQTYLWIL